MSQSLWRFEMLEEAGRQMCSRKPESCKVGCDMKQVMLKNHKSQRLLTRLKFWAEGCAAAAAVRL